MAIAKVIEVLAQSNKSWDDAARQAYDEARKTVHNIKSIYVKDMQADVNSDDSLTYRINAKVTFIVGDE